MTQTHETEVCIVGGGPAGMLLAVLLARRGLSTLVLERNTDFAREFRGEILQPRFTQLTRQIGLFDYLEGFPHDKITRTEIFHKGRRRGWFELRDVAPDAPFILWMTQPTLLNALADKAATYQDFTLWHDAKVTDLVREEGRITGVHAQKEGQPVTVKARLVIGADGRFSTLRKLGPFALRYESHRIDVLWFLVPRPSTHQARFEFYLSPHHPYLIFPKHPDMLQCGMVLKAGSFGALRQQGLDAFRQELTQAHPLFAPFAAQLTDFKDLQLLQGHLSYTETWAQDGCLLIGDAAHTCSPVGGVGVSIAVGTAIVAADVILDAFAQNDFSQTFLSQVQTRRHREIRLVHRIQNLVSLAVPFYPLLQGLAPFGLPLLSHTRIFGRLARRLLRERTPLTLPPSLRGEAP